MVKKKVSTIVLIVITLIHLVFVYHIGHQSDISIDNAKKGDITVFTGLCVYSKGEFSIITNGIESVVVYKNLSEGKVYTVRGKLLNTAQKSIYPLEIKEGNSENLNLTSLSGTYWEDHNCYILTPQRVRLNRCLDIPKGIEIEAKGLFYGHTFYLFNYTAKRFLEKPKDGYPYLIVGTVIDNRTPSLLWTGREKVRVYLPYRMSLKLGDRVKVLGIAKLYSTLTLYVSSRKDIEIIGKAEKIPIGKERIGDIAYGTCQIIRAGRGLSLNCTHLKLYSYSARTGDVIRFEALRRENSLLCLNCSLELPREMLVNSICAPNRKGIIKIKGNISWVKIYKNGFGLANVTNNGCWILIKLRKSLNVELRVNHTIMAFGVYTEYRGMPALEIYSRGDLCLENFCSES